MRFTILTILLLTGIVSTAMKVDVEYNRQLCAQHKTMVTYIVTIEDNEVSNHAIQHMTPEIYGYDTKKFLTVSGPSISSSQQTRFNGGNVRRTLKLSYSYVFIPQSKGKTKIPGFRLKFGTDVLCETAPIKIDVMASENSGKKGMKSEADARKTTSSYLKLVCDNRQSTLSDTVDLKVILYTTERPAYFKDKIRFEADYCYYDISETSGHYENVLVNGVPMIECVLYDIKLLPLKKGKIKIPPVAIELGVEDRHSQWSIFQDSDIRTIELTSNPVTLKIK